MYNIGWLSDIIVLSQAPTVGGGLSVCPYHRKEASLFINYDSTLFRLRFAVSSLKFV